MFTNLASFLTVALTVSTAFAGSKIEPSVFRAGRTNGVVAVVVEFQGGNSNALDKVDTTLQSDAPREQQIELLRSALINHATETQASVLELIDSAVTLHTDKPVEAKQSWISNKLFLKNAPISLLEKISKDNKVATIRVQEKAYIDLVSRKKASAVAVNDAANEWGVETIKAPSVWANGNKGAGVVVGSIDTGVRLTHEALQASYRGDKGWFDPYNKTATPNDNHGHGSHTVGTIAGSHGIGVAPEAKWIACKGCDVDGCTEEALNACFQFMLCPTDADGKNPDCKKAPHIVNNSWGSKNATKNVFKPSVDALRKAGIIPIFSNGNAGPRCGTVGSPGSFENVVAVGATEVSDKLAYFSSKGPSPFAKFKPDISAPGDDIRSASHEGDNEYQLMSGTSMAAPHITGVVALIKSANPAATYDDVYQLLTSNVDTESLKPENLNCGNISDATYPNNNYGFGRVNAYKILPY